tara:strand:+ start:145 stop:894 length:750 start_codon:yes stop_codon:yes gene_type:complete
MSSKLKKILKKYVWPFVFGFLIVFFIMNVLDPFDNKLSKSEKKLIDEHDQLAMDWAECRDEYYALFKSENISSDDFKRTFATKYLPKNQECVSKLKLLQQFLKENENDLDPIFAELNTSSAEYQETLEVNFKDFDSKDLPLLIQNKKLAESFITCKTEIIDDINEYSEDPIASIEDGSVGQLLMDISTCKGKITAFEKFLEINEKELIAVFEGTEWDYYQLVGALEATDGQLDTTYNEFSEAQSLYYNS